MRLYEVPKGSKIKLISEGKTPPAGQQSEIGEVYKFRNIDGMYSYCLDSKNNVVHLVAWAEVEIVDE